MPRRFQGGMANLLMVLMIGLGMIVTTAGVVHAVRSSQEGQLSLHAITPAQQTAWTGSELVRRYLETLPADTLAALSGTLAIDGLDGLTASVVRVDATGSPVVYRIVVNLTGKVAADTGAATAATLQVVYGVTPGNAGTTPGGSKGGTNPATIDTINIYKDLNMTGGIAVLGGQNANLNVQGNVVLDSASITGVNSINATGNVSIGSGIHVNQVYANGDVTLTGSASVAQVSSLGNVIIQGGASPVLITANGSVTFQGGGATTVKAMGDVLVQGGGITIGSIATMGNVLWTGSGGGATSITANGYVVYAGGNTGSTTIQAKGDVTLTGGGAHAVTTLGNVTINGFGGVDALLAKGNLNLNAWASVTGTIGGTLTKASPFMSSNVTVSPGLVVTVPTVDVPSLAPVTLAPQSVDAYALRASSNYAFTVAGKAIQVTVSGVTGVADGTYFLGSYPFASGRGYQDFLCTALVSGTLDASGKGTCLTPATPGRTLCQGQSTVNSCLSYTNGTWKISGRSFARGVIWFEGDLNLDNGYYLDTAIATGNIFTSGSFRLDSPNFAGYAAICTNATPAGVTLDTAQVADFAGVYPTAFCDTAKQQLIANPIGNIGLLAGGYVGDTFSGGNIDIGASSVVNGSVIAGNQVNTGGSSTINGFIMSSAQNAADKSPVSWSGSTSLNFAQLPNTYSPGTLPCMKDCAASGSSGTANSSVVQWTRYL
ncbi:MAG: hypothetical protein WBW32_17625 [Luteibacter sp.]